jgi:hypothetical protein
MGAPDGYFRQFEELERLTKPLREMEAAVKAAFDLTPLRETLRQFDFDAQYKTAVTKMGLDLASIHKALRQFDAGEQLRKSLEDSLGGCAKAVQETMRRTEDMCAGLNVRLPEMSVLAPDWPGRGFLDSLPQWFDPIPYDLEAHERKLKAKVQPKRPIGFIDTNDL